MKRYKDPHPLQNDNITETIITQTALKHTITLPFKTINKHIINRFTKQTEH